MKTSKALLWGGLSATLLITGCRSRQEAAGDKYRKMGDPIHALMSYEEALQRGPVSREFYKNYTLINIQAMGLRAKEDPTAEFLDVLKDTVASLLKQHPDPDNEQLFSKTLQDIGTSRMKMGTTEAAEGAFRFFQTAETLGGKAPGASSQIGSLRKDFLAKKLVEIQKDFASSSSEPTAGIVADYKMSKIALIMGGETPEMKSLWSQIRKANLNTYLMYDNDDVDLGEHPDARINKYGVLLGIVKYEPGATAAKIQVKAWNGSSGGIHFDGDGFTLYDNAGKAYKPTAKIGHFSKKDVVAKAEESKTGGLTFPYPSGTVPAYLEFKSEAGITRKYLP